jgi:exonuclease III
MMASLNINSLLAHIHELRVYMNSSKIDALTINETKLDSTIEKIYLPGFEIIRKDRTVNGRNGWGVCIFLRSNINSI